MNGYRSAKLWNVLVIAALLLGLLMLPGGALAQEGTPEEGPGAPLEIPSPGAIPVQGRLYDAAGVPLNGSYTVVFSLYTEAAAAAALCADTRTVVVKDGLFNNFIDHCYDHLTGQKVWLGVKVGADPEMTPRQVIYPVAYAIGLVPGYSMVTTNAKGLSLETSSTTGKALTAVASSATGAVYGVYATNKSPDGVAGYFYSLSTGTGVQALSLGGIGLEAGSLGGDAIHANSGGGAAVALEGTGRLTSTAKSYLWISGNNARAYRSTDTTVINLDLKGSAIITRGAALGNKIILIPVTMPGDLYGQPVRITGVDIHFAGQTEFDAITQVQINKQKNVCDAVTCYDVMLFDTADYTCDQAVVPNGCKQHWNVTANNVISDANGFVAIVITLAFNGDTSWIRIGGVRLTLEHD